MSSVAINWPGPHASAENSGASRVAGKFLLAHVSLVVFVAAIAASLAAGLAPSVRVSSVVLTLSAIWMLYSWVRVIRTVASPYWLFILVATLFNGGQALLEVFGVNVNGVLEGRFSPETTSAAILYAALCLMFVHLGALWRVARERGPLDQSATRPNEDLNIGSVRLGIVLVMISAVPMYLQLQESLGDVFGVGYFGLYQREVRTNIGAWQAILAQFMLPGVFLLAASARYQSGVRWLSLAIVAIYAGSYLFMGYRGAASATIAAFGWIWHTRVKKLPLYPCAAAGLVFVLVIFPMIRVHRGIRGADRLSLSTFLNTLNDYDNPATASLTEIGGTMSTTAYTMELVPADRDFEYGKTYAFAVLTLVPNIFGTALHPSVERGTASEWLIRTVNYQTAAMGGGMGYSFIAEAYLNFGWVGPPFVMILTGFLFAAAECYAMKHSSPAAAALMGVVLFFGLVYTRAETSNIVRSIVWCGLMPVGVLAVFSGSARRRLRIAPAHALESESPEAAGA